MASLQLRGKSYACVFCWHGKRKWITIGKVTEAEARTKGAQVEYLLMRLEQGVIELPRGSEIVDFVRHDGKPPGPRGELAVPSPAAPPLGGLRDLYQQTHASSLEERTLDGIRLHFKHLASSLGERFPIAELSLPDLQGYVERRSKARGHRGRTLSPATIKKEIIALRTAWNWAAKTGLVPGKFPNEGLRYPKHDEKPPFQTREQVERQLPGATEAERADLWDSFYPTLPEVEEILGIIPEGALHPWVHPMVCTAAHRGARRSELVRMRVTDVDLALGIVRIREKKRARGRRTTRDVPLSPILAGVLKDWLARHPGGPALLCHEGEVGRSR